MAGRRFGHPDWSAGGPLVVRKSLPPYAPKNPLKHLLQLPVLVAALGYFVDMYDLFLFSVVRVPSLKALGSSLSPLLPEGVFLLNLQLTVIRSGCLLHV